jgi:hypothetical protein
LLAEDHPIRITKTSASSTSCTCLVSIKAMAASLRPQYFLSRENGTITPLVAVDELPLHVLVRGVPRTLQAADTVGMTSLGTVQSRGQLYVVDGIHPGVVGETSDGFDPRTALQVANPQKMAVAWNGSNHAVAGNGKFNKERRGRSKDQKVSAS